MARAQSAYLARKDVPARQALQQAIDALKFKVTLDDGYVPFETSGYLPCTFDGEDAGFTIKFHETLPQTPALQAQLGERNVAIDFKWSGDVREFVSAMAVSAALAKSFGALVHDPDGDKIYTADQLIAKVNEAAAEL
jgi:hypothetical protein